MSEKIRKDVTEEMTSELGLWRGEAFLRCQKEWHFQQGEQHAQKSCGMRCTQRFNKRRRVCGWSSGPVGQKGGSAFAY